MEQRIHNPRRRAHGWPLFLCLLAFSATLFSPLPGHGGAGNQAEADGEDPASPGTQILVSYFYTTVRCPTCRKLETYSRQAVEDGFPKELKEKRIVFRSMNVDDPDNKHYLQDYKLYTKSLVVSETRNGQEVRWKNLPAIWKHVRDPEIFKKYVREETAAYLEDQ